MKLYNYNKSGEFTGITDARLDILESKKQKKDVFLRPARTTTEAPIIAENKCPVYDNGWSNVDDYRGQEYYDQYGKKAVINTLGDTIPTGVATEPPPADIKKPEWENGQWVEKYVKPFRKDHLTETDIDELNNARTIADLKAFIIKFIQ